MKKAELYIEAKHRLGEGMIWDVAQARLLWIDLLDRTLHRHDPASGKTENWQLPFTGSIGAIATTEDPDLLMVAHQQGLSLIKMSDQSLTPYANPEGGRDTIIYNDMKCDRWGRLWAGTSHMPEKETRGALWCVTGRDRCTLGDAGFAVSNGPAFSPDGTVMYFNDSLGRQTLAYDINRDDPLPRNRRLLRNYAGEEGLPDGATVDAEGNIWIAHWAGARISQMTPKGEVIAVHPLPTPLVTSMCFAGPDYRTLYITTAREGMTAAELAAYPLSGSIFRLETHTQGLPEPLIKL